MISGLLIPQNFSACLRNWIMRSTLWYPLTQLVQKWQVLECNNLISTLVETASR